MELVTTTVEAYGTDTVSLPPDVAISTGTPSTRLVSNTAVQLVGPVLRMGVGLISTALLTRYLGVRSFGEYGLVFAYVATFSGIFNNWGLATILLREISQRPSERSSLIPSAALLQGLISAGTYLLLVTALLLLTAYPADVKFGASVFGLSVLLAPLDLLALTFQADLRLSRLLVPSVVGLIVGLVLLIGVILLRGSLIQLIAVSLAGLAVQYVLVTRKSLQAQPMKRPTTRHWIPLLKDAWPLGVATVFGTALQQGPILVLSLSSLSAVGLYAAATKVPAQLAILPLAIRGSTFPLLSRSWMVDRGLFARQMDRLMALSALMGVTIALVGVGLAPEVMHLLFGPQFAGAAPAFSWLMIMAAVLVPGILLGEALIAAGFQRVNLVILAGSLPVAGVLLFLLAPNGATGAAAAVAITYCATVLADVVAAWLFLKPAAPLKWLVPAASSLLTWTVVFLATSKAGALGATMAVAAALVVGTFLQRDSIAWLWRRTSPINWSLGGR